MFSRPGLVLLLLVLGACAAPPPGVTLAPASPPATARPVVWVIAHRGGAGLAPENTLASFENGIALGSDVIEMDAHLSRDGVVMIIHDPTLDRTTDGTGPVNGRTVTELQSLNAASRTGLVKSIRQPVPTLAQVLELLEGNSVRAEIEIKTSLTGRYQDIEAKVLKDVTDRSLANRVQVSSFDFGVLADLRRLNPKVKTVALLSLEFFRRVPVDQPSKVIDTVSAVGADMISVNKDLLTLSLVQEAHRRGLQVEVWTVDTPQEMEKFIEMGVEGITSNLPDLLKHVLR